MSGQLIAAFVEESLEQQLHTDRIDGSKFERIADHGVGCGAASLHEKPLPLTIADDVPDDEEVARETQLAISVSSRSACAWAF